MLPTECLPCVSPFLSQVALNRCNFSHQRCGGIAHPKPFCDTSGVSTLTLHWRASTRWHRLRAQPHRLPPTLPPDAGHKSRLSAELLTNRLYMEASHDPLLGLINLLEPLTELKVTVHFLFPSLLEDVLKDPGERPDASLRGHLCGGPGMGRWRSTSALWAHTPRTPTCAPTQKRPELCTVGILHSFPHRHG